MTLASDGLTTVTCSAAMIALIALTRAPVVVAPATAAASLEAADPAATVPGAALTRSGAAPRTVAARTAVARPTVRRFIPFPLTGNYEHTARLAFGTRSQHKSHLDDDGGRRRCADTVLTLCWQRFRRSKA